jgi:DNA-binding MarR family transcriptional regulator
LPRAVAVAERSGIVDRLERDGMVRRSSRVDDRRYARIDLTGPVGDWLRDELPDLRVQPSAAALSRLSGDEQAAMTKSLGLLQRLLEAQVARAHEPADPADAGRS